MANSLMQIVSDGSLTTIPLTIKFFEQSHIYVYVNNVLLPNGTYTFAWTGATTITITPAVVLGAEVSIRRKTPADETLHDFQAGAVFSEVSIDENFRQDLYLLQEASEQSFVTDLFADLDMHGNSIHNVRDAVLGGSVPNLAQVQRIAEGAEGSLLRTELASIIGASLVSYGTGKAATLIKSLASRMDSTFVVDFATEYMTQAELNQILVDYGDGEYWRAPTVDITSRLIQAIADLGGSHDITTAYLYEPARVLQMPPGLLGLNITGAQRILCERNNINIVGRGMFNTRISHMGTGHVNELIRFKEAYACGVAHLTLDGGLPFTPNGTETYGADIPLVLDQCAHFYSEGLNLCNYRHRGLQAIHLWESYLGNDFRCFNGGWFRVAGSVPGGVFFDDFRKESTFFPGSESNQVYFGKYAFSGNGSVIQFKSPCFNMRINQLVSEARTYGAYVPAGIDSSKIVIDGLSSCIVIDQAWFYFHDQAVAAVGAGAVLFDFVNAGPGCYLNNQMVYQEIPTGSSDRALEVSKLISNGSAHPVNLQMTVQDANCTTALWNGAASGSLILGDIYYRKDTSRTIDSLMGAYGPANFVGRVTMSTGSFVGIPPLVYQYEGKALVRSAIDGGGSYDEHKCRAVANFNGSASGGGARMQKGITVVRTAIGTYQATFTQPMPDDAYTVTFGISKAGAITDAVEIASMLPGSFSFVIRDAAGTLHDSPIICINVHR